MRVLVSPSTIDQTHAYQHVCIQRFAGANGCGGLSRSEAELQELQVFREQPIHELHTSSSLADPMDFLQVSCSTEEARGEV